VCVGLRRFGGQRESGKMFHEEKYKLFILKRMINGFVLRKEEKKSDY
jgi:hypothetical protein